jgi:hypothetical protein
MLKRHKSIGVYVVYIDTGSSMPISPSKSRDVADESNTILTEWKLFETTVFWHSCKWNRCRFEIIWLGNENTRLYLTKTKQSSYYFNLFQESNLLSYLCWLTHPGLNVSTPTFRSRDQYIREIDARNRASVCGLPGWSTVMRTNVLY